MEMVEKALLQQAPQWPRRLQARRLQWEQRYGLPIRTGDGDEH